MKNIGILVVLLASIFPDSSMARRGQGSSAIYMVPVDGSLQDFNKFEITDLKSVFRNGAWKISYSLPMDLVGYDKEVEYTEVPTPAESPLVSTDVIKLVGKEGVLICDLANEKPENCSAKYDPSEIQVNFPAVEQIWKSRGLPDSSVASRMEVIQRFSGELVGIFTIP